MNKPRVVLLTQEFFPTRGGIGVYCAQIAAAASAAGHGVEVWAPRSLRHRELEVPYAVKGTRATWSQEWPSRIGTLAALWRQRGDLSDAVIYVPEPGALRAFSYLDRFFPPPRRALVLTIHGTEVNTLRRFPHRRRLFQRLLDRADRVGVISQFTLGLLQSFFRVAEDRIVLVPGAAQTDLVAGAAPERPLERPGQPCVIVTVGRISPRKGQLEAVRGLAALPQETKARIEYRLVGPVNVPSYLDRVREAGRAGGVDVVYAGEVSNERLAAVYRESDIFLMTSRQHGRSVEGYGIVYLEASAHGLPCIAGRSGGASEAVRDGETGLVVDSQSPTEIASAVDALVRDPGLRATFGRAAREWARTHSWTTNAERLFGGL